MTSPHRQEPSLALSLLPAIALVGLLFVSIALLGTSGHIPLIAGASVAALVAVYGLGQSWSELQDGLTQAIAAALPAILILMAVGLLIGVWIASGVVPLLIYYGLQMLSPTYFLAASCVICALVSISTGSSWSTAATAGLALVGVGQVLGMPLGLTAGAVISGSYFGDKMSPLSDTTNLAAATAGSELFEHVRHMLYTTTPALLLSLAIYLVLGFRYGEAGTDTTAANAEMMQALAAQFDLTPWLLLAPAVVLGLILRRTPPLPALLAGALAGGVLLLVFQPQNAPQGLGTVVQVLYSGYSSETGLAAVDELLTRGGLTSMLETIALIICAFAFGGVMETSGMLARLTRAVLRAAHTTGSLVLATLASGIGMNILAADQYLAVVLPGRMYRDAYLAQNLHPKNLSRALEDSATLTSALVPWNTCGAYMAGVLGVPTLAYAPFAFLNWTCPLISLFYGYTGLTIEKLDPTQQLARSAQPAEAD